MLKEKYHPSNAGESEQRVSPLVIPYSLRTSIRALNGLYENSVSRWTISHNKEKLLITGFMAAIQFLPSLLPVFNILSHSLTSLSTLITLPGQKGPITSHVKEVFLDKCRMLGPIQASVILVWEQVKNFALFSIG